MDGVTTSYPMMAGERIGRRYVLASSAVLGQKPQWLLNLDMQQILPMLFLRSVSNEIHTMSTSQVQN